MGCWGMGMTECDEFPEVYDAFMKEYDAGGEPADIRDNILRYYLDQFEEDDPVMNNVWFALAKAEWMCCALSDTVFNHVKEIIESGKDLDFLEELGADASDLRARKRNLNRFLNSITKPRETPRKRKPPKQKKEKKLPPLQTGDVISYPFEGGRRVIVVLDAMEHLEGYDYLRYFVFCGILKRTYSREELKTLDPMKEELGHLAIYDANTFLPSSSIRNIGNISFPENLYVRIFTKWNSVCLIRGRRKDFQADYSRIKEFLLQDIYDPHKFLPGGMISIDGWLNE